MGIIRLINIVTIVNVLTQIFCIKVLNFGDPKDLTTQELKIGNISDDTYEVFIESSDISFPIGQDLTICYRWFFEQLRFTDAGSIDFHLKFFKNETDMEGVDEIINVQTRQAPNIWAKSDLLKLSPYQTFESTIPKYGNTTWYKNLMADLGNFVFMYRPQIWRSFCHLVDWRKREQIVVVNGEKLFSEPLQENADYFEDDDRDWPQAKLSKITFGPRINEITMGKTIGTLTDLNVFSQNIGEAKAIAFTGECIHEHIVKTPQHKSH